MVDESMLRRLVERSVQGDQDDLQRLLVHYYRPLRAVVDRRMGELAAKLRRRVDADDVVQMAYLEATKSIERCEFDGPAPFYKWLERIALDQLKSVIRDHKRGKRDIRKEVGDVDSGRTSYAGLLESIASDGTTPSQRVGSSEFVAALLTSLARLTDDQRAVVVMRSLKGMEVEEVALALGKSRGAVYALYARGLSQLQMMLGPITQYMIKAGIV